MTDHAAQVDRLNDDADLKRYILEARGVSRLALNVMCIIGTIVFGWLLLVVFNFLGKKKLGWAYVFPIMGCLVLSRQGLEGLAIMAPVVYVSGWIHANVLLSRYQTMARRRMAALDMIERQQQSVDMLLEKGVLLHKVLRQPEAAWEIFAGIGDIESRSGDWAEAARSILKPSGRASVNSIATSIHSTEPPPLPTTNPPIRTGIPNSYPDAPLVGQPELNVADIERRRKTYLFTFVGLIATNILSGALLLSDSSLWALALLAAIVLTVLFLFQFIRVAKILGFSLLSRVIACVVILVPLPVLPLIAIAIIDQRVYRAITAHVPRQTVSFLAILALILAIPMPYVSLPLSVTAVHRISHSNGLLRGKTVAWIAIVLSSLILVILFVTIVLVAMNG